jgi:acyl-CoA reductase-like NAD-dependent aldehyde dehydrogenase
MLKTGESQLNSQLYVAKEAWLKEQRFEHTVAGADYEASGYVAVTGPATGLPIAMAPLISAEGVNAAIVSAHDAFSSWRFTSFVHRRQALLMFAELLCQHADELADIFTLENGRARSQCMSQIKHQCKIIQTLTSFRIEDKVLRDDANAFARLTYKPLGVVAAIAPWNVPVTMAVGKSCHAIYTGNTVVLKPSPYTPLTTLRLGELARQAFPPGVLNVISGGPEAGRQMTEHPLVAKVTFTGSGRTGAIVAASAASTFKRATLELGGNDAAIVLKDADIASLSSRIFAASFANSGQVCMAIKRLFVHKNRLDDLVSAMVKHAESVIVGDGFKEGVQLGPIQNEAQFKIVTEFAQSVSRDGGSFVTGGKPIDRPGYFFEPSIAVGLKPGSKLVDEEPFGPIIPIIPFGDVDEAIAAANSTSFGLSASVWSSDSTFAESIAERLEAGTVWVNDHLVPDALVPMGGFKSSGLGREYGELGLLSFMEPSTIVVGRASRDVWFNPQ